MSNTALGRPSGSANLEPPVHVPCTSISSNSLVFVVLMYTSHLFSTDNFKNTTIIHVVSLYIHFSRFLHSFSFKALKTLKTMLCLDVKNTNLFLKSREHVEDISVII